MTLPPPDRFGHADAWANGERYRWAAQLLIEGASRRCERINAAIEILKACAERHPAVRAALQIHPDGPGPGPRSIRLDPEQRQLLRAALVALSTR